LATRYYPQRLHRWGTAVSEIQEPSPLAQMFALTPPKPDDAEYYEAFGRFISSYSGAENAIHHLLRHVSRISETKARLLFGGMRVADVCARIKALLPGWRRSSKTRTAIETCLKQFDVIGRQRDKLVHRYIIFSGNGLQVSNQITSKTIFGYERDHYTLIDIRNMTIDCMVVTLRIYRIILPSLRRPNDKAFLEAQHPESGGSPAAIAEEITVAGA
jgi:hypothetical protein